MPLRVYAWLTAAATLGLVGLGGLVTSHGAGMAVPDWPTTYGYNMFLFPISGWVGGIFYEHTHRLWASVVGLLTVVLAVWMQVGVEDRRLRRLGWIAVGLVLFQGLLGGLRVKLMKDQIGVFHAGLAQAFLALLVLIAVYLSPAWARWRRSTPWVAAPVAGWAMVATGLVFLQLLLGAAMRHQHAGLAVPDFPLAYGELWPPTDEASVQRMNAVRVDARDFHPITANQIRLHMLHRIVGVLTLLVVANAAWKMLAAFGGTGTVARLALAWVAAILAQVALGAWTVWSNKAADVATLHVVVGAINLAIGVWAVVWTRAATVREPIETERAMTTGSRGRRISGDVTAPLVSMGARAGDRAILRSGGTT